MDKINKKFGFQTNNTIVDDLLKVPKREKGLNMPITEVFKQNSTHQIDLLYLPNDNGSKYLLVCVDLYFPRYIEAYPLKIRNPVIVKDALLEIYKKK